MKTLGTRMNSPCGPVFYVGNYAQKFYDLLILKMKSSQKDKKMMKAMLK